MKPRKRKTQMFLAIACICIHFLSLSRWQGRIPKLSCSDCLEQTRYIWKRFFFFHFLAEVQCLLHRSHMASEALKDVALTNSTFDMLSFSQMLPVRRCTFSTCFPYMQILVFIEPAASNISSVRNKYEKGNFLALS